MKFETLKSPTVQYTPFAALSSGKGSNNNHALPSQTYFMVFGRKKRTVLVKGRAEKFIFPSVQERSSNLFFFVKYYEAVEYVCKICTLEKYVFIQKNFRH
jgi:hypothetical protein